MIDCKIIIYTLVFICLSLTLDNPIKAYFSNKKYMVFNFKYTQQKLKTALIGVQNHLPFKAGISQKN